MQSPAIQSDVQHADLHHASCFDVFPELADDSVDLVCVDPPYGTTAIEWDVVIDFKLMWQHLARICKPTTPILVFGSQPFSSLLIVSKLTWFRYELIWNKNKCGSPGLAKYRPQKVHENIMVFSQQGGAFYQPIMEAGEAYSRQAKDKINGYGSGRNTHGYGFGNQVFLATKNAGTRYPKSILHAGRNFSAQQTVHPTQKPTNLLNYLIMTYSKPSDTVLDFAMGSGSCGVSAKLTNRHFIGVEKSRAYFDIAKTRIAQARAASIMTTDRQLATQFNNPYSGVKNAGRPPPARRWRCLILKCKSVVYLKSGDSPCPIKRAWLSVTKKCR